MKEIKVTLSGEGVLYWFEHILKPEEIDDDIENLDFSTMEEEGILDMDSLTEVGVILSDVKVEVDGKLIVKKGKYINTKEYLSKMLELPCFVNGGRSIDVEEEFIIKLNDDEEFDPMKLQLVKTDYEVDFIPYGILYSHIIYDGKEIPSEGFFETTHCFDGYNNYIIDYKLPYVG